MNDDFNDSSLDWPDADALRVLMWCTYAFWAIVSSSLLAAGIALWWLW